jgi:hypothetical protein
MSNASRTNRVLVAATSALLLASLAMAGTQGGKEKRHARVKKQADGTVSFKQIAPNTSYESIEEVHARITDPRARAEIYARHFGLVIVSQNDGGLLNGSVEVGTSQVQFHVTGQGALGGINHTITLPASFEVHSAPHKPGADIDTFETNMNRIQGEGKADRVFEYIRLVGGTANGYPSPGQMTLISKGDEVEVDSVFNVGFRLDFKGAKGGPLDGIEDSMEGSVTMRAYDSQASATTQPARTATAPKPAARQQ